MKREWIQRGASWAAVLCVALLAGCTSYVTTQVTAFSDWSGRDATRTYAFTRTDTQKNSIEESTYEPIIANELSAYAFRQVPQAQARYLVGLTYAVGSDLMTVPQPVYYDPRFAPGPCWRGGPWGPWGAMSAGYVAQTYQVFDYTLGIRITERATGKEVYNVSARTTGDNGTLLYAMPFLARSALADFPLSNGSVRSVRLPVVANERAVPAASAPATSPAAAHQTPISSSVSAPNTTNSTTAIPCTSFVGRRCTKRSPSRIAGTFAASIIPNVVPPYDTDCSPGEACGQRGGRDLRLFFPHVGVPGEQWNSEVS